MKLQTVTRLGLYAALELARAFASLAPCPDPANGWTWPSSPGAVFARGVASESYPASEYHRDRRPLRLDFQFNDHQTAWT